MPSSPCAHLDQIRVPRPDEIAGCEDCLATGSQWVSLRVCRTCGHVSCCDSSPNKHARSHARTTGHPIVTSGQPGEKWSWCYEDEVSFVLEGD